jgi:hypothetical protein
MPIIHLPNALQAFCDMRDSVEVTGTTLREVFRNLESICPELTTQIITSEGLRSDLAVAIDGSILDSRGLTETVDTDSDIYLVPPLGGG